MADGNINAPEVSIAAASPPTRFDEQILPRNKWVPVGKSNCFLDVERTQANPIFKIAVDILKNTNFFKAFTASSTIPSIYIQQFWDTIRFDKDKGYSCQLDERRFYLTKATLRYALQLPQDNNNFTPPPNANSIISFVNELGYPNVVRTLFGVVTNDMYQPWRALTTIINLFLTGKTSAFERPRAPVLQILWGVVKKVNIDYAERIWEEFTQCIHSFIEDKMNLALHTEGKKKVNPLVIPGVRFTKLIINHLQNIHKFHKRPGSLLHPPYEESTLGYLKFSFKNTKRVRFGMAIPDTLISEDIRSAPYYLETKSDNEASREGQAESDPGKQVEGQAGSDPGVAADSRIQPSHVVHAGPNLEHMYLEVSDTSPQPNPEQMDEEFTTTAYPNKSQEDEPEKTSTEVEVQSMVTVPIHQDTSSVPLMTSPIIDLTVSQPASTTVQASLPTSTATTAITTTTTLPPPQPQQGVSNSIIIQRIGELERSIMDQVDTNQALEE
ncbi:hypothetical protein Tco_1416742, partial [Tanacetum coccineum]